MSVTATRIRHARTADIASVLDLRDRIAVDLLQRGQLHWDPSRITTADLVDLIDRDALFVAGAVLGTISVRFDTDSLWGAGRAGYVRMLMVEPSLQATGLGRHLVSWAGRYIFTTGRSLVRLDCPEQDDGLRRFYEGLGFRFLEARNGAALFERSRDGRI
ncbi:GNAT family N-acetyltransferase [soil metagenome]